MTKKKVITFSIIAVIAVIGAGFAIWWWGTPLCKQEDHFKEYRLGELSENKLTKGKNTVQGVVLHHTACSNVREVLGTLFYNKNRSLSCHLVIDRDGTRYVLASPEQRTHHAGYSMLHGTPNCNNFTIGIEFQSIDTHKQPLTCQQINSAIEYLMPIIRKYNIPLNNIVTHEQVRTEWLEHNPESKALPKIDISQEDHKRFMTALKKRLN